MLPSSKFALISFVGPSSPFLRYRPDLTTRRSFPIGVNPIKYYGYNVSADFRAVAAHSRHDAPIGRSTFKTGVFLIRSHTVSLPIMVATPSRSSHARLTAASPSRVEDHNMGVHAMGIRQLAILPESGFGISCPRDIEVTYSKQFISIQGGKLAYQNGAWSRAKMAQSCLSLAWRFPREFFASVCRLCFVVSQVRVRDPHQNS
jgi:hypothetical protein